MSEFSEKYLEIEANTKLRSDFTSNAVNQDRRIYQLWNSNIKTLNTYYKYLNDILTKPNEDNHHKYRILEMLKLYSKKQNEHIKYRQSIASKVFQTEFGDNTYFLDLVMFFLSLDSKYPVIKGSEFIMDSLPNDVFARYDLYLKKLIEKKDRKNKDKILNPLYGILVMYSNKELMDLYLDEYPFSQEIIDFLRNRVNDPKSMLSKRIHDCQPGSFINEAKFFGYYFTLCEINLSNIKGYDNIIDLILKEYKKFIEYIDPNSTTNNDWNKFKDLLVNLSESEKKELLYSIGNISVGKDTFELLPSKKINKNLRKKLITGNDVITTAKQRRGQQKFRRALLENDTYGCRIKHCKISEPSFLTASHILSWKDSDAKQKVDKFNGLLLCPTHDFLFDNYLISFNDDGTIIISKAIDPILYKDFNIDENTKINVYEENKKYLRQHRNRFYKKEE